MTVQKESMDVQEESEHHEMEMEMGHLDYGPPQDVNEFNSALAGSGLTQHEINIEHSKEFSFDKR